MTTRTGSSPSQPSASKCPRRLSQVHSCSWRPTRAEALGLFTCTLAHLLTSSGSLTSYALAFQLPLTRTSSSSSSTRRQQRFASRSTGRRQDAGSWLVRYVADDDSDTGDPIALSITTFNVLAPIFKRVGTGRESEFRDAYLERHAAILEHLKGIGSDVICLQELWVAEQEMVDMYQSSLDGYRMYTLPRTEARGDGVACFVKEGIEVLDREDLRLKGVGGRVALFLRLGLGGGGGRRQQEVVVANTHLLFPHARTFSILRIREVRKLLAFVECYTQANDLEHLPVVLCGDFNGRSAGRVYQHLTARGFRCSYEDTLGPGADCSRWITHVNHLGEELGVDYIWYRNFDASPGPVEPDWKSIVYQSTKQQLLNGYDNTSKRRADQDKMLVEEDKRALEEAAAAAAAAAAGVSLPEGIPAERAAVDTSRRKAGAGSSREGDDDRAGGVVGAEEEKDRLSAAVHLLGLSEGFELSEEELKLLLDSSADDCDFLFPTILDGSSTGLEGATSLSTGFGQGGGSRPAGCRLETASSRIWPASLEQGVWPKDYAISDHGSLTACFRVVPTSATDDVGGNRSEAADSIAGGSPASATARRQQGVVTTREGSSDGRETRDWGSGDDGYYGLR